uniref:cullin-associated NEDD8-dissociated protein 1-like n=1 Tax=Monopterus albus TaxID=43700 RepID=UPI0009B483F9|nr:cullin-associated NEDD8-dissociated protein 1-like [Monopterus albus]
MAVREIICIFKLVHLNNSISKALDHVDYLGGHRDQLRYTVIHRFKCNFLKTLQDKDINVPHVALVMFNSAAHNKPSLIWGLLPKMGLFKHTVGDGLDVRKAAFECIHPAGQLPGGAGRPAVPGSRRGRTQGPLRHQDADVPDAGQTGVSVSCCRSAETGLTGGAT